MTDSRATILSRVRGSSRWVPDFVPKAAAVAPSAAKIEPWSLAEIFAVEARKIDCEVWVEHDAKAATARLKGLLEGAQVLAWDLPFLDASVARVPQDSGGSYSTQKGFDRAKVDVGLTGCDLAIAETGSVVLAAGPGKPREASLVVRTHVALVDPSQLVLDLNEALGRIASWNQASHINIISGPSRTADIEMTLTRGVHGPKKVILIVAPWLGQEQRQ
jgi:L-lactate dehydrogenase complex protein LldG